MSLQVPCETLALTDEDRRTHFWGYRLAALCLSHTAIDSYATFLAPIIPLVLVPRFSLSEATGAALLSLSVMIASFAQPLLGYVSDRRGGRWLVILAPAVSAMCAGNFLTASAVGVLVALIVTNAVAIAAFHPEAAALAGSLNERRSNLTTGLFVAAGPIGISLGPMIVTWAAARPLYPWWLPGTGIGASLLLYFALPHGAVRRRLLERHVRFFEAMRGRWARMLTLVTMSATRAFVAIGLSLALPVVLKSRLPYEKALATTGWWLSLFLGSGAFGGVICSLFIRREWERAANILSFSAAAPLLILLPHIHGPAVLIFLIGGGFCMGCTNPIVVAMGQRAAPATAAVASALMLGFSWGIGGGIAPMFFSLLETLASPEWSASAIGGMILVAATAATTLKE